MFLRHSRTNNNNKETKNKAKQKTKQNKKNKIWSAWGTYSLPLLTGSLLQGVVVLFKVPSTGKIDLFVNYSHLIVLFTKENKTEKKKIS